jgi:hypothetical protein
MDVLPGEGLHGWFMNALGVIRPQLTAAMKARLYSQRTPPSRGSGHAPPDLPPRPQTAVFTVSGPHGPARAVRAAQSRLACLYEPGDLYWVDLAVLCRRPDGRPVDDGDAHELDLGAGLLALGRELYERPQPIKIFSSQFRMVPGVPFRSQGVDRNELLTRSCPAKFSLVFVSPTRLSKKSATLEPPTGVNIFAKLARRWEETGGDFPPGYPDWLRANVAVEMQMLQPASWAYSSGRKEIGWTGMVQLSAAEPEHPVFGSFTAAMLAFAEYAGVGIGTAMGLGRTLVAGVG